MKPIFLFCMAGAMITATVYAGIPEVTNVTAVQRAGTKFVDITYNVSDSDGDTLKIRVEVSDNAGTVYSVPAFSFTGAIGDAVTPGNGKTIVWNAGVDWDGEYSEQMRVKVIASDSKGFPGLEWSNEIPPGGFLMGQDGGTEGSGASRHINIPWSFWMSKYEIRNDQYCEFLNIAFAAGRVKLNGMNSVTGRGGYWTGVHASETLIAIGDTYDIRWNVNRFEVVGGKNNFPVTVTWYGAIAFAQQYGYDLPTDAEWEKAARGPDHDDQGEHRIYPWGNTISGGHANYISSGDPYNDKKTPVGYYNGNQIPTGPDTISGFGLYDLIGNVAEWTRSGMANLNDYDQVEALGSPIHRYPDDNYVTYRVTRGGHCRLDSTDYSLRIHQRTESVIHQYSSNPVGFRVVRRSIP